MHALQNAKKNAGDRDDKFKYSQQMHQNRHNSLVNCHIERFLIFFTVSALLNILCIFYAFFLR